MSPTLCGYVFTEFVSKEARIFNRETKKLLGHFDTYIKNDIEVPSNIANANPDTDDGNELEVKNAAVASNDQMNVINVTVQPSESIFDLENQTQKSGETRSEINCPNQDKNVNTESLRNPAAPTEGCRDAFQQDRKILHSKRRKKLRCDVSSEERDMDAQNVIPNDRSNDLNHVENRQDEEMVPSETRIQDMNQQKNIDQPSSVSVPQESFV